MKVPSTFRKKDDEILICDDDYTLEFYNPKTRTIRIFHKCGIFRGQERKDKLSHNERIFMEGDK